MEEWNPDSARLSIVIAVYNDQEVIDELYKRLKDVLDTNRYDYEILFIDDASSDNSFQVLQNLRKKDENIRILKLTRNFGQPNAIAAGMEHATGDLIVIMDSDLQDPPESIPTLIEAMKTNNVPMAIARWESRPESWFRRTSSSLFSKVTASFTDLNMENGLGIFRVLRRELVDTLRTVPERTGTSISLLHWMGIEYVAVDIKRDERFAGTSGYTLKRMLKLTCNRLFSYSMFPIRFATTVGILLSLSSILLGLFYFLQKFFAVILPGWTTIVVLILFLFGVNFFMLGLFGEYMGRIFIESRGRPKYVIDRFKSTPFSSNRHPGDHPDEV